MVYSVFDLEADELLEKVTKIHCLSYRKFDSGVLIDSNNFTDYGEMCDFILNESILIGHKIVTYDIPVLEKILNIKVTAKLIDTLGLSWYLYPERLVHGLDEWGYEFGIAKPTITNWLDLPVEDYTHRCSEDVKINVKLWENEIEYLKKIYNNDSTAINRFLGYISFKLDCARQQEEIKWKVDKVKCEENLKILSEIYDDKLISLSKIMPKHITYKVKEKPKVMYKKDGSVSAHGEKWFALLKEMNLPDYHNGALKLIDKTEDGNPGSHQQLKDWLFSLGWIPITFKYVKDKNTPYSKDTPPRKVPQLQSDDDSGLCESVKDLFEKGPKLEELEDLFLIRNRVGILKGFLECADENDFIKAGINGFTNTLRMQHRKPIANLPGIPKKYWEMIRECLVARDSDHILCGSDMSGLEDSTKKHYMYYYDPEYVKEMSSPGFDGHIDIAIRSKMISWEEGEFYKYISQKKENKVYRYTEPRPEIERFANYLLGDKYMFEEFLILPDGLQKKVINVIKPVRLKAKKTNFAAVYGAGGAKIALTAHIPLEEGNILHTTYWERNWAVKKVAENTVVRIIFRNGVIKDFEGTFVLDLKGERLMKFMGKVQSIWLYNPISQFYYSLRYFKDIFSTLNQGTGVYCFDMWIKECRSQGYEICMQYHDEHVGDILKVDQEKTREILTTAIDRVNYKLKLNIKLGISIDFGNNYKEVH